MELIKSKDKLVVIRKNELFTTTLQLAEWTGNDHVFVMRLLKKYSYLEDLSDFESQKLSTKGRAIVFAYLTELQATLLLTLMKNSEQVIKFKVKLTREFFKQRKILQSLATQKANAEWMIKIQETKVMRKELTDTIQEFIEYAKSQGSKSAEHYYMNISRMELTGLFILEQKYPNARDVMSVRQLNLIEMADEAISISLRESMDQKLHYKECYQKAKEKIELLVKIFPRSPLPQLLGIEKGEKT